MDHTHLVIENIVFDFLFGGTEDFFTAVVEHGATGAMLLAWTPEEGVRATRIGRDHAQSLEAQFPAEISEFPSSSVLDVINTNKALFVESDRLKILGILKEANK